MVNTARAVPCREQPLPVAIADMGPGFVNVPSEAFAVRRNPGSMLAGLAHDQGDRSGTERPSTLFQRRSKLVCRALHNTTAPPVHTAGARGCVCARSEAST